MNNNCFWKEYYKNKNNIEPSQFSQFIYQDFLKKYNDDNISLKIADIGCGNFRDSVYFSTHDNMVYAIDLNNEHNENNNMSENIKILNGDAEEILKNNTLLTKVDVVYMRWFLHSMPYDKSERVFKHAYNNLKQNGLICIEVRSDNDKDLKNMSTYDETDKSYKTTHKRWLYKKETLEELANLNDCDCEILFCEEGHFSKCNKNETETNNPLLLRIVLKKNNSPAFKKSENYDKYKHILPKMTTRTFNSYRDMNIFNEIIEKHNISYVGLAGTALGINRHGGIIPWDNDIDVGFIPSEWTKLKNIKDELINAGLKLRDGSIHCHFGLVDCFKIQLNKNKKMYSGPCKTFCTEEEYKNRKKQILGNTWVYLPFNSNESLKHRYGDDYFFTGNVNDNFHFVDKSVKNFKLNEYDKSYQVE